MKLTCQFRRFLARTFRPVLGHHLFKHPLSPYDEKSAQDAAKLLPRMKEQASTATTTTHPLFMAPFTPEELKNEIKKLLPDKSPGLSGITNRMLHAGELISKDSFSSSSTVYGNFTRNPQAGKFLFYNPSTKDTIKTKQTQHPTEAYISMTPSLNSLKVSSLLD